MEGVKFVNSVSVTQQQYVKQKKRQIQLLKTIRILILIAFLMVWELATNLHYIDGFFFSSPSRILLCIWNMLFDGSLLLHIRVTLYETLLSFLLIILFSMGTAMLFWLHPRIYEVFDPFLVVLNSLPKSALAPLFIVWLGTNVRTIIVAGISVAVFGSIISLYSGFANVDKDKIKLIYTLGGGKKDALKKVVVPGTIPVLLSTMKVNIGLALVGVIIGEFLAARRGLGYLIIYGSQVFKLDWVIMSIVILCIIAIGLYSLLNFAEKKYLKGL